MRGGRGGREGAPFSRAGGLTGRKTYGFRFPAALAQLGLTPLIIGSKRDNGIVHLDMRGPQFFTGPSMAWRASMSL